MVYVNGFDKDYLGWRAAYKAAVAIWSFFSGVLFLN
jgi:hypothetical protein